jgi:hypothetical protein
MQNTPIKNIAERNADNALVFDILFLLFYCFSHLLPLTYVLLYFITFIKKLQEKKQTLISEAFVLIRSKIKTAHARVRESSPGSSSEARRTSENAQPPAPAGTL